MDYFYTVCEEWMDKEGNIGNRAFSFKQEEGQMDAKDRAAAQFHNLLATGAVADGYYYMAMIVSSDGWIERAPEVYDRRPKEEEA